MKKLILLLSLAFTTCFAKVEILKRVPVELEIVISGLDLYRLSADQYEALKKDLKNIDGGLRILKKHISSFIIKSETYKTILEHLPLNNEVKNIVKNETFILIRNRLKNDKALYGPFSIWLIDSILKDGKSIEKQKRRNKEKIGKKEILIGNWLKIIGQFSPDQFNFLAHKLSLQALKNISLYLKIASKTTTGETPADFSSLKFFKFSEFLPKKKSPLINESITVMDQLNKEKKERTLQAKKIAEKIQIKPKKTEEKNTWKPKPGPKLKKPWVPKKVSKEAQKLKEMNDQKEAQDKKKKPQNKGKVFKLEDV